DAYPLLLLLNESAEFESLPLEWIEDVATEFAALLALTDERWKSAKEEFSRLATNVTILQHTYTTRTGKPGQPKKNINPKVLHEAFKKGKQISLTLLASILGIDRKTLRVQMKEMGIDSGFDDISNNDLDNLERRSYQVPRPNALWHIDGHHKLIAWGIVIHGVADGYSRK
ncbi:hypothetical protein BYT27DRAFT_7042469, partial [Phlegmacium glaucopus]